MTPAPEPTPKPDRRRATSRRDAILAEARQLFAERGPHLVTTRDIARAVGISQPSLYAHFPSRDAIAVELCQAAFAGLERTFREAAVAWRGQALVGAIARAYIAFGLADPAAYRIAFMQELPDERQGARESVLEAGLRAFSVLLDAYRDIAATGNWAAFAAQSTWASLHGLVSLLLARPDFPFQARDALIEFHLAELLGRCRAPAATAATAAPMA